MHPGEQQIIIQPPLFTPELVKDLAVYAPYKRWGYSDPLLLMQVTEFACGGFVVGATWNHIIADGQGMAQFLQAVGELARRVSPLSVVPVRCDESLVELSSSTVAAKQSMLSLDNPNFASMDISIPMGLISRIKAEFSSHVDQTCTVFEVVTAVLWQCRTRVVVDDPNIQIPLVFVVNIRKHIGAKDGYYGNCIIPQVAAAKSGTVASGSIIDIVKMIKNAKEKIQEMPKNGQIDASTSLDQLAKLFGYNAFYVTSWRNLGFETADFGSGTPARVFSHIVGHTLPTCVILPSCKGKDAANVLSVAVEKEHASRFVNELSRFT